jgi:hypothetical protein
LLSFCSWLYDKRLMYKYTKYVECQQV